MKLHLSRSNMQNSNISVHEIFQCGSTTLEEKSFLVIDQPLRVQKLVKLLEENNLRTEGEFILYQNIRKHYVVESLQTKQHTSRSTENHNPKNLSYVT